MVHISDTKRENKNKHQKHPSEQRPSCQSTYHFLMEYFRHGAASRRRQPHPVGRAATSLANLLFVEVDEGFAGSMVIYQRNGCLGKRMKYGVVNFHLHPVSPNADLAPLDSTGDGHGIGEVVPLLVEEVTADLGDLIPSVERASLVEHTANVDAHVADRRQGIPPQVERREEFVLGMVDGDLHDGIGWNVEHPRSVVTDNVVRDDQRQDVKVTLHGGRIPTKLDAHGREGQIDRIAHHTPILALVGGISDELPIPNPDGGRDSIALLGEDGDDGLDGPSVPCVAQMFENLMEAFMRGLDGPAVAKLEVEGYLAHDAAAGVAPGQTASELELLVRVAVAAVGTDVAGNIVDPILQILGRGKMIRLGGKLAQKGGGFLDLGLERLAVGIADGGEAALVHHGAMAFVWGAADGITRLISIDLLGGIDGDNLSRFELLESNTLNRRNWRRCSLGGDVKWAPTFRSGTGLLHRYGFVDILGSYDCPKRRKASVIFPA